MSYTQLLVICLIIFAAGIAVMVAVCRDKKQERMWPVYASAVIVAIGFAGSLTMIVYNVCYHNSLKEAEFIRENREYVTDVLPVHHMHSTDNDIVTMYYRKGQKLYKRDIGENSVTEIWFKKDIDDIRVIADDDRVTVEVPFSYINEQDRAELDAEAVEVKPIGHSVLSSR